ncbi:serine/threonine-protein kinase [Actinoplanes sp. NPDC049118]|uniref:serine/threonine-protein kinase n=1 Tax=Actinoplanes sp. NPDC049118 TaxID=3155769 RepID=UPI00340B6ECD
MSSLPLRPGDPERLGDYEIAGRLGAGGMGTVFLGRSAQGRPVAIKVVRTEFTRDEEFLGRFRSEVNRARQVPPFCTAEVLDADPDHDPPYLVVEYVEGPNLADVVREQGPLSPAALHSAALGIATALTAIHGAGVIHRDLKPGNVLFALGGVKVIDFGIARPLEVTSRHTRTDQMVGTVAYMAPERFDEAPAQRVSPAADIFAWGAVVAFAGTGRTPFAADSAPATAMRILTQPPELGGLPAPLRGIVARTLAKDPADRPTARELLDLLLAGGEQAGWPAPRPVPDDPAVPPQARPARGRMVRRAAIAVAAIAAVAVVAVLGRGPLAVDGSGGSGGPSPQAGGGPGSSAASAGPAPAPTGNAAILAGTRRTLIHFAEIDRDLAMPYPDEVVASDGTGKDALFVLVPTGVDFLIKSVRPTEGEQPCLGVKVIPEGSAELVATECAATKATLFSISATGDTDDKGRPTYTLYNDAHGLVQWYEAKSEVYVEHPGDAPPDTTFSFVDRGPA